MDYDEYLQHRCHLSFSLTLHCCMIILAPPEVPRVLGSKQAALVPTHNADAPDNMGEEDIRLC